MATLLIAGMHKKKKQLKKMHVIPVCNSFINDRSFFHLQLLGSCISHLYRVLSTSFNRHFPEQMIPRQRIYKRENVARCPMQLPEILEGDQFINQQL